jgi:catechol-2,3-dioxygenase
MPVIGFNHYNLRAPRELLRELRDFYCDVVGLIEGPRPTFRSSGYWLYSGEQPLLHLTEAGSDEGQRVGGASTFDHAAFSCKGREQYEQRLTALGIGYQVSVIPQTSQVQLFFSEPPAMVSSSISASPTNSHVIGSLDSYSAHERQKPR